MKQTFVQIISIIFLLITTSNGKELRLRSITPSVVFPIGISNQANFKTGIDPGVLFVFKRERYSIIRPHFISEHHYDLSNTEEKRELIGGGIEFVWGKSFDLLFDLSGRVLHIKELDVSGYQLSTGIIHVFAGWQFPAGAEVSYTNIGSYQEFAFTLRFEILPYII